MFSLDNWAGMSSWESSDLILLTMAKLSAVLGLQINSFVLIKNSNDRG